MIAISKAEKEDICVLFPYVHIVRTMKQKSKRHHYYCEESKAVLHYLEGLRGQNTKTYERIRGVDNTNR